MWQARRRGRRFFCWSLLVAAVVAAGCAKKPPKAEEVLEGSGVPKTLERDLAPFTALHVGGVVEAKVTLGKPHLLLRGDENLVSALEVTAAGERLALVQPTAFKPKMTLSAEISGPELAEIIVDVASRTTVEGLHAQKLSVRGGGAARLSLAGTVDELTLASRGVVAFDLTNLAVRRARVKVLDAVSVTFGSVEELDVETHGAALVSYQGETKVTRSVGRAPSRRP
ncbi:MAG TPA: DUF2807 domain-containing protein [Polyangiaceae bacterium]|nr:DUF2807 domain-containing protein [Polyangiaceae bacterium]